MKSPEMSAGASPAAAGPIARAGLSVWRRMPRGLTLVVVLVLVLYFLLIFVLPVAQAFWYSLNVYDIQTGRSRFVGVRHYGRLLGDPQFWTGLRVAFVYSASVLAVGLVLQLGLAAVLTTFRGLRKTTLVTLFFLPAVLPNLAVIIIWRSMYRVDYGLLDVAAAALGVPPVPWMSNGTLALVAIVVLTLWKFLGYGAVIFMAGLNEISDELYEAAAMDGAGKVRQFFSLSLPLLRPLLVLQLVASVITLFQFFDPFYALTNGGPSGATQTLILYIYNESFLRLNFSYAAAMTTVLFLVLLGASAFQLWLGRRHLTVE